MTIPGYTDTNNLPGLNRTTAGLGGDVPQQTLTGYTTRVYKHLYKSPREVALLLDKTLKGGYGSLPAGTVLAEMLDDSGNGTGYLVPYVPKNSNLDFETDFARIPLVQDNTNGSATDFVVDVLESYKVGSGEEVVITDDGTNGGYLGPQKVSSVSRGDRTATITIDTSVDCSATNMLVSNNANLYVKAGTADQYSDAKYVLDMDVDTGAGQYAKNGLASVLLSNAILRQDAVTNMDSDAQTDLGNVSEDGTYFILK